MNWWNRFMPSHNNNDEDDDDDSLLNKQCFFLIIKKIIIGIRLSVWWCSQYIWIGSHVFVCVDLSDYDWPKYISINIWCLDFNQFIFFLIFSRLVPLMMIMRRMNFLYWLIGFQSIIYIFFFVNNLIYRKWSSCSYLCVSVGCYYRRCTIFSRKKRNYLYKNSHIFCKLLLFFSVLTIELSLCQSLMCLGF